MMDGHEKSDPEIVAIRRNAGGIHREKPANNAAPAAAEPVERRAGTKGNAGQQSTLRAQDRAPRLPSLPLPRTGCWRPDARTMSVSLK
jgi:RNA-directed DNA polymerase